MPTWVLFLLAAAAANGDDDVAGESVIQHQREDGARGLETPAGPDGVEALARDPALTISRQGGPLAPAQVTAFGLGGNRIVLSFAGIPLNSPLDGHVDGESLPVFGAGVVRRSADGLELDPSRRRGSPIEASLLFGSLGTVDLTAKADVPVAVAGPIMLRTRAGVRAARTDGDFVFRPHTSSGLTGPPIVRMNNAQQRFQAFTIVDGATAGGTRARGIALYSAHKGGIPGFATAPLVDIESDKADAAGKAEATTPILSLGQLDVAIRATLLAQHLSRRVSPSSTPAITGQRLQSGAAISATYRGHLLEAGVDIGGTSASISAFRRRWGNIHLRGAAQVLPQLVVSGMAELRLLSDVGVLPNLKLDISHRHALGNSTIALSHRSRAPTLDELYTPSPFVRGNPMLQPERLSDVAFNHQSYAGPITVDAGVLGGRIHDAVLYVNRNAFEVVPVNTGEGLRAFAYSQIAIAPMDLVSVSVSAQGNLSHLAGTKQPLPTLPQHAGRLALNLGRIDIAAVRVEAVARGPSNANLAGTLKANPYLLWNAELTCQPTANLRLSFLAQNILDVQTAVDSFLLPLPGRTLFARLEVRG